MSTERAVTTAALTAALKSGAANGQDVNSLAFILDTTPRAIRRLVDDLIEEGVCVCAHPKTGYYIAATREEAQATYDFLRGRGLHNLKKASQLLAAFNDGGVDPIQQLEEEGAFAL